MNILNINEMLFLTSLVQVKRRHARSLQKASDRFRGQCHIKGVPEKPSQSEILFFKSQLQEF